MWICLTPVTESKKEDRATQLEDCLERIVLQDMQALSELYTLTSASVYAFALSILKNTHDAEDVLHDCYVQIHAAAAQYRPMGKPLAWILTITKNMCFRKLSSYKRTNEKPIEDWAQYLEACPGVTTEEKVVLHQCMNLLSDESRQIVILHAVAGFKHREIAQIMDLPLPNVLAKYNRAIKKLRTHWRKEEGNE